MIPTLTDFTIEKNDPHLPCFLMPLSRNRHFFGRADILTDLDKALVNSRDDSGQEITANLRTYALCAPGGMGKTQIATEFVHRRRNDFDAVFWVNADESSKLLQSFHSIAISLGLVLADSLDSRDQTLTRDLVLGWLAKPLKSYKQSDDSGGVEATWLLIFDNADNPEVLNNFWPIDSSGSVLITSRDPLARSYLYSQGGGMLLPPLQPQEATKFFLDMTGRSNEPSEQDSGDAAAKVLGGIPLAISQMAAFIARRDLSFSEFLKLYEADQARAGLFKLPVNDLKVDSGYDHTIASVWALESLKKGSVLLEVISLLDADGIQEYILDENEACYLLKDYPQSSADYQDARAELSQSSLIARERNTKTIVVHRLIQDAARAKMSDQRFTEVFGFTLSLISSVWPYEDFGFGNELYRFEKCGELYHHVLWLRKVSKRFRPPMQLTRSNLGSVKLLLDASWQVLLFQAHLSVLKNKTRLTLNIGSRLCVGMTFQKLSHCLRWRCQCVKHFVYTIPLPFQELRKN